MLRRNAGEPGGSHNVRKGIFDTLVFGLAVATLVVILAWTLSG